MHLMFSMACVLFQVVPAGSDGGLSERFGLVHGDPPFVVELGSAWNRHDFTWAGIEREKGVFDFGEFPGRVDRSLAVGVNLLPILDYNPAWDPDVSPADEETLEYWERYVERTVAEFKGKLRYWQVWNEPNYGFWKPESNPRDYTELLRRSYFAAKRVDPACRIVGVNCSGIDLDFTEQVFRYGGLAYCDVLAYQPYRIAPEVGHFEEMKALRELVAQFGEQRPIWFTEMGWGSQHFPFRDADDLLAVRPMRRQAAFLVRYMTIIQAVGVEKVFWFSQAADGAGLEDRRRDTKRLSFYAYQYLIATLDGYSEVHELWPHGSNGVYAYLFACPAEWVAVAWSVQGPQESPLPGLDYAREMRDVLGEPLSGSVGSALTLTGEPVYLFFDEPPAELMRQTLLTFDPPQLWHEPGSAASVEVICRGASGSGNLDVRLTAAKGLEVTPRRLTVEAGESASVVVKASKRAKPQQGRVTASWGDTEWDVEVNLTPHLLWTYQGASEKYLKPTVMRQPEGEQVLLLGSLDTPEIVCLSLRGEPLWRYVTGAPTYDSLVVEDIDGDGRLEMVAAMPNRNVVIVLDYTGVLRWRATIPGDPPAESPSWRWTRPEVGEGGAILFADAGGYVNALAANGSVLWRKRVSESRCDLPICVADVNPAAGAEILVGDKGGTLHCLAAGGDAMWRLEAGSAITTPPVVAPLESGGAPCVLFATHDERLFCVANSGRILWSADLGGTMDLGTGMVPGDLDADGTLEVVVSTRNHEIIAFNSDGTERWRVEAGAQFRATPQMGDVDGDGEDEIVIASADWRLYCIDPRGTVEWTVNIGNRADASLLLHDLDGDGVLDIVVPVRGGKVMAFSARP